MSLHDKSLLVTLSLASIGSSRADRQVTREVLNQQQAQADAGRWVARLWPKEALEPLRTLDSQIRAFHTQKTLPWLDQGQRIISARAITPYFEKMRALRAEREAAVASFIDRFDHWLDRARSMRGEAFNPAQYPNRHQAARRFSMELASQPIPHRDDFRISLAAPDLEQMQNDLDERLATAEQHARQDLYQRIAAPRRRLGREAGQS